MNYKMEMSVKDIDKKSKKSKNGFLNSFKNLSKKQRIIGIVSCVVVIVLAIGIPVVSNLISKAIYESNYPIVATREDFIGKTFAEAKKLADEKGIRYDINNGNGIYDWESEDTQIMDWITTVYDEKDDFVRDYNQYTSHGFELRKGWRISMATDVKTDKQKADEEVCKAKEGYTFTYKDGKVDCHKTQEALCKEKGGIWNNSKCKTKEEIEAEEKAKQEEATKKAEAEDVKKDETKRDESSLTTITGRDHDDNDYAGKYDVVMNACLDQLEYHYGSGTYPYDSGDGYPISYKVVFDGDVLVYGEMSGYFDNIHGDTIAKQYTCKYENGVAKLAGIDY